MNILSFNEEGLFMHESQLVIQIYYVYQVREICEVIASGIQPIQNLHILQKVEKMAGGEEKMEWGRFYIAKGFTGNVTINSPTSICT
jgi:hypothetical protein